MRAEKLPEYMCNLPGIEKLPPEKALSVKNFLFLLGLFMAVLTVLTAAAQPPPPLSLTEEERAWLNDHQTLRLGVGVAFPPYMWVDQKEDGGYAFKGMVSDYVNLMEERLGVEMQVVFGISFKEALARARDGRIDFFPCISSTPERSEFLLFTEPYFTYPMVIIVREDAPLIGGIKELADKRFATTRHLMVYSKLQNDYPDLDLDFIFTGKVEENLEAVSLGRADACIIHLAVASYYIQKKGLTNLRIGAPVYWEGVQHAMAVRRDWPLLRGIVAKTMASISQEERDEISQRWIRVQYEPGVEMGRIVRWTLGIGAAILLVFFLVFEWNRRLTREITARKKVEVEREEIIKELRDALEEVKTLQGFIPICAECKNIRNDGGYWQKIEKYVQDHSDAQFSHSICPDCAKKLYPDLET